jgi:hypothetical protein
MSLEFYAVATSAILYDDDGVFASIVLTLSNLLHILLLTNSCLGILLVVKGISCNTQ